MSDPLGDLGLPFPVEFLVRAAARLHQTDNKRALEAWKTTVGDAAATYVKALRDFYFLDERPVAVTILYFPLVAMQGDVDNIVKPIVDGMKGVLYRDDRLVERVTVQKFEPGVTPVAGTLGPILAEAIGATRPVLYVRVDDDLGWRRLP